MQALQRAAGRKLNETEQEQFRAIQIQALRWTYIGSAHDPSEFSGNRWRIQPGRAKAN